MAVVKANYVKKGDGERTRAKATIRYIQHRPGKDKERTSRALFGIDGPMGRWQTYRMIDDAPKGRYFYRFVMSPDPETEDKPRDLPLRQIFTDTMQTLEERLQQHIPWVAAIHDDHTDKRHIHALAIVKGRLKREDLEALIHSATQESQLQRENRDVMQEVEEYQREREEALWLSYS
jgi:hypothetical protein